MINLPYIWNLPYKWLPYKRSVVYIYIPCPYLEGLLLSRDAFEKVVVPPEDEGRLGLEVGHVKVLAGPLQSVQEGAHVTDLRKTQLGVRDYKLDLRKKSHNGFYIDTVYELRVRFMLLQFSITLAE